MTIPPNQSQHTIQVLPINDSNPELTKNLSFTFTAPNHETDSAEITILDDEPPLFQNLTNRFDVANGDGAKASDALRIINELARRGGEAILDPEQEQPGVVFFDVNGDYRISALDALQVINELARLSAGAEGQSVPQSILDFRQDRVKTGLDDENISGELF